METQIEICENLKIIFARFLQENFSTTNSVYFEKLISHLRNSKNIFILQAPFSLEWVEKCISILEVDFRKLNPQVISFMLNFTSLLTSNEWIVIEIGDRQILDRIFFIIEQNKSHFNPSMKLASIRIMSAVSRYSLGLGYIRKQKAWRLLLDYCNKDHTLYVVREARQLIYELLYKLSVKTNDEQTVLEILQEIMQPIHEIVFEERKENIIIDVDDSKFNHMLSANLDLLSFIFQQTLESEEKTNIAHLCEVHHNLEFNLWKLCQMTAHDSFLEKCLNTMTSMNFAKLVYDKWESGQIAPENFNEFGAFFFNMMKFTVGRRQCLIFLNLAKLNHILWKKLGQRAPREIQIGDERIRFENQLTIIHCLPIVFMKTSKQAKEELFDEYIVKIFEISSDYTLRICYVYRDVIVPTDNSRGTLIPELACKAIHGILSMEKILERDQAVLVSQAMIFALKEFILNSNHGCNKDDSNGVELILELPNVLHAALIGLQTLIQRYNISWKESIETTCLVNLLIVILENPNLSTRLAVQALKLVQLSIEHFLSPNMALLVDNLQGSGLVCLGPIIVKRFHDIAWEVRDSTLELVTSIANISRLKFPAFQKLLAENNICPIVYQMAKNDSEPYVRASALKCLTQMISINIIWEDNLSKFDLIEHLFSILYNESEALVRKEAVTTLARIFESRKIPSQYQDTLYSIFTHSAIADLHWEVKVEALYFWKLVIQRQFTNQGMIDGTFPNVTFSKELKKIVQLTQKEVNSRIVKIFNELSQRGCLGVLLKCLNDECDFEVIKVATNIAHCLSEKANMYDYDSILRGFEKFKTNNQSSQLDAAKSGPEQEKATTLSSDEVIECILSDFDMNYLISACEQQLQVNGIDSKPQIDKNYYKNFANVTPKEFLSNIKAMNLDQILSNHNEWILCAESFLSLLIDILNSIKYDENTNTADCY